MINIEGAKYFRIDISEINLTDESDHRRMILFNIMSDPSSVVDIDLFKKTPMASIIFVYDKDDYRFDLEMEGFKARTGSNLANMITAKTAAKKETVLMPSNSEFKYIAGCTGDKRLHPIVLMYDMNSEYTKEIHNYVVAAIPCRGIITPLKKSKGFDLYNGELVMTGNFDSEFGYMCNRIIYVFARVNSYITIEEYYHDAGEYIGLCTTHTIGGLFQNGCDTLDAYDDFVLNNRSRSELTIQTLEYKTEHYIIPYDGNEALFSKTGGNIFSISSSSQSNVTRVRITS